MGVRNNYLCVQGGSKLTRDRGSRRPFGWLPGLPRAVPAWNSFYLQAFFIMHKIASSNVVSAAIVTIAAQESARSRLFPIVQKCDLRTEQLCEAEAQAIVQDITWNRG